MGDDIVLATTVINQ